MPRSRASDEALSSLLIVNLISFVFVPNLSFQLHDIVFHLLWTILCNAMAILLWCVFYNGFLLLRLSVPLSTYWNKLAPIFRVAVLLVFLYFFCLNFTYRVLMVGLISSYFVETHKKLTSRRTLVANPDPVADISASNEQQNMFVHGDQFTRRPVGDNGVTGPSPATSFSSVQRMTTTRRRSTSVPLATTPFGDRIVPSSSPSSSSRGSRGGSSSSSARERRGHRLPVIEEHRSPQTSAAAQREHYIPNDEEEHRDDDDDLRSEHSSFAFSLPDREGQESQSAQALAEGRPQESHRNTRPFTEESSNSKRKRKVTDMQAARNIATDMDVDEVQLQPDMKKKSSSREGDRQTTAAPSTLWQQVYQGISAFVGADARGDSDNNSVKRKRAEDNSSVQQHDAKRSTKAMTMTANTTTSPSSPAVATSPVVSSKRTRAREESAGDMNSHSWGSREEADTTTTSTSPDSHHHHHHHRRHKVRRGSEGEDEEGAGERGDDRQSQSKIEAVTEPQSKYLQELMKKKEAKESSSSQSSALVVAGAPKNSARPALHRRSSSAVSGGQGRCATALQIRTSVHVQRLTEVMCSAQL